MGRSQETFNKKEVRQRKEKKRKDKEKRRMEKKENEKKGGLDDMIAYVDENGMITTTPPDPNKKRKEIKKEDIEISVSKRDANEEPDSSRKGKVSFFNESKGYGFIRDLESQGRIFFHVNNVIDEIRDGDTVKFNIGKGPKGTVAMQVELFNKPKANKS